MQRLLQITMKPKKYSKSFQIALSAISCAVASAFLALGILSGYLLAMGYLIGILALMVPLSKQFYAGGFLAYVGTCILAFVLGAVAKFWDLVPFIMFFGLHPLANSLQIRFKINRWIALAIKAVWFVGTLFAGYFMIAYGLIGAGILQTQFFSRVQKYIYVLIPVVGGLLFIAYDYLIFKCQIMINSLIYRIKK